MTSENDSGKTVSQHGSVDSIGGRELRELRPNLNRTGFTSGGDGTVVGVTGSEQPSGSSFKDTRELAQFDVTALVGEGDELGERLKNDESHLETR